MNRPVGASSTDVMTSANERFGNGSLWSGPTSVIFMPGILGNVPAGSPVPTGGGAGLVGGSETRPGIKGGGAGTSTDGIVFSGGLNGSLPNGVRPGTLGSAVVPPGAAPGGADSGA